MRSFGVPVCVCVCVCVEGERWYHSPLNIRRFYIAPPRKYV